MLWAAGEGGLQISIIIIIIILIFMTSDERNPKLLKEFYNPPNMLSSTGRRFESRKDDVDDFAFIKTLLLMFMSELVFGFYFIFRINVLIL